MHSIRSQFPIFKTHINGHPLVYFDNAATTQKPKTMTEKITKFYENACSNVHRSINPLGELATHLYEHARSVMAKFIGAETAEEVIFTRNATESINLVAKTWARKHLQQGDIVVLPISEHHSNIVPWLQLRQEKGIELRYIPLLSDHTLDIGKARELVSLPRVCVLTIATVSNALGTVHPVEELIDLAKKKNILTVADGTQSMAHYPVDVKKLGCDFFAFSGHKMFGPTGIGVLWGKRDVLFSMPEFLGGGEMIHEVFEDHFTSKEPPLKYEAGTPHIAGAIGLGAAVDFITSIGFKNIQAYEHKLTEYLFEKLHALSFVRLYGQGDLTRHIPLASFTMQGIHAHDIADMLGEDGICIRAGHHCAMPLHAFFGVPATARASLSLYNTTDEIDAMIDALKKIYKKLS